VPFGNGDRELLRQISSQLTQAVADLAALKQQVADQQHAIDQIRQDTTASITTGLAEIRAVAREGLARTNDIVTGPVASIGNELVAIRGAIAQLDGQLRTAAAAAPPASEPAPEPEPADATQAAPEPEPVPEPEQQPEQDLEILQAAAGISAAILHAHRHTCEFLVKHAGQDQHFHLPGEVQHAAGTVLAKVSGPSLVAALTSLHGVSHTGDDHGTRAIAAHLHGRLTETVQEIVTRPHRGDGADPVRIIIDDRAQSDSSDSEE
jgi:hypothetical protein